MKNIFNINLKKIENINGGDIYIERFNLLNNEIELKIIENEFNYEFILYVNNEIEYIENLYVKNFEFRYENEFNENINNETYNNLLSYLIKNDNEILNEIIYEIDKILIDIINNKKYYL